MRYIAYNLLTLMFINLYYLFKLFLENISSDVTKGFLNYE